MSREIKFRAWNANNEEMIMLENSGLQYFDFEGSYSLGFTVDAYSGFYAHEQYETATDKAKDFPIMQFAGIKDRNGIDIYEGDILKCDFSRDNNGMHDSVQVVEFYEGSFGSRNKGDHFRIPALFSGRATQGMNLNYYEIIGNTYQNPELIPA